MGQLRYSNLIIHEFLLIGEGGGGSRAHTCTVVFGMMQCCDLKFNFVPMKVPCSLAGSVMFKFKWINHIFH